MNIETFTKLIANMKADSKRRHALYKLGVDIDCEIDASIITALGIEAFGKDDWDWIAWFCWEADFGEDKDMTAHDKDGHRICYDVPSLFECVNNRG